MSMPFKWAIDFLCILYTFFYENTVADPKPQIYYVFPFTFGVNLVNKYDRLTKRG